MNRGSPSAWMVALKVEPDEFLRGSRRVAKGPVRA